MLCPDRVAPRGVAEWGMTAGKPADDYDVLFARRTAMSENAERKVYLNGEFVSERDAKISIFDSALMFGDMVFEMTRSFNQKQHL